MLKDFCVFGKFLYYDLQKTLKAYNQSQSKELFDFIEKHKDEFFFVGFLCYEFYLYLKDQTYQSEEPYCVFYAFKKKKIFKPLLIDDEDFIPKFIHPLDKAFYKKNFKSVKKAIAKGQSYQVNLSQKLSFQTELDSFSLFNLLLQRQNTKFKAYIKSDLLEILSFSPELFFKTYKNKIITKPMKGTIKRAKNPIKDKKNKNFLRKDGKSLSENVMIVDLLRNDLSKIIKKHSQKVKLFKLKTYPSLHQMFSCIKGRLKKKISFYEIFSALFPCGSITGAPKLETMKLIENLENKNRGVYCGAIGVIHKEKSEFSVAIRTLEKRNNIYHYGVGSGLVWESEQKQEFKELKLKAKILQAKDFYLFETMLYKNGSVLFFKEHLQRLINSSFKLGFKLDGLKPYLHLKTACLEEFKDLSFAKLNHRLFSCSNSLLYPFKSDEKDAKILKFILHKNGELLIEFLPLKENSSNVLLLSNTPLKLSDKLFHKSSLRKIYQQQSFKWEQNLCYDLAFFNEKNELCEGSRTNIVLKKGNEFFTPSLKSGLLNGIYRQFLLDLGIIKEKVLFKKDLQSATELYCINSVRGAKKVVLSEEDFIY